MAYNKGISLILPAYLEAENLSILLPKLNDTLKKLPVSYEIIVVDTLKAMDNTKEIAQKYNAIYLNRTPDNYYGDAIRTGINNAKFSFIAVMDADGSHNCEDLLRLYEKIQEGFDVCIGSRYIKGGNTDNSFILKAMSVLLNFVFVFLFKLKVKDISNSFRIYDSEKLKSIKINCNNFDVVEEILLRLNYKYKDLKIAEIPIVFNKRINGKSKRNTFSFIISYIKTMFKLLKLKEKIND